MFPPYSNIARSIKSLPIIGSPPEKSPSADTLPVKIRPAWAAARRGGFLPVNYQPVEDFSRRRSYNGALALI